MRKYQPAWMRIRKNGRCVVEVHRLIAARVVKAVIKEKDGDAAFKLANQIDKLFLSISRENLPDGKTIRITFILKQRYGLVPIAQPDTNAEPEALQL